MAKTPEQIKAELDELDNLEMSLDTEIEEDTEEEKLKYMADHYAEYIWPDDPPCDPDNRYSTP